MLLTLYTLYRMQASAWPGERNHSSPPAPGGNEQYSVYRGQDFGPNVLSETEERLYHLETEREGGVICWSVSTNKLLAQGLWWFQGYGVKPPFLAKRTDQHGKMFLGNDP